MSDTPRTDEAVAALEAYFRSGNNVPVERATIPAELVVRAVAHARQLERELASSNRAVNRNVDLAARFMKAESYESFVAENLRRLCPQCGRQRSQSEADKCAQDNCALDRAYLWGGTTHVIRPGDVRCEVCGNVVSGINACQRQDCGVS